MINRKLKLIYTFAALVAVSLAAYMLAVKNTKNNSNMSGSMMGINTHAVDPMQSNNNSNKQNVENNLPIPKLLENESPNSKVEDFTLNVDQGTTAFMDEKASETYGYNGNFLGPVIRVNKDDNVNIHLNNNLKEETTIHWHGLNIDGNVDGGPHQPIASGSKADINFKVNQPASTLWFHPHTNGKTSEQVYKGLAGLLYVEDEVSKSLNIPKDYGVNDIPLIVQDRYFDNSGTLSYNNSQMMDGALGNTILVNGAINPYLDVKKVKMRFRLVNGSNARIYSFELSTGDEFEQISSDGGFLEKPVKMNKLELGPGERAEIIIDFSKYDTGTTLFLTGGDFNVLKFNVKDDGIDTTEIPNYLTQITQLSQSSAKTVRRFNLQGMGNMVSINGKQMDMNRIDLKVKLNDTEIWEITNPKDMMGGMSHPFHVHGVQFQVLSRNGIEPLESERGWKDTVLVNPDEDVKILIKFTQKGLFMYHCHILEHEDAGMMGQFEVE
ncbi:FtsP/CotA-like multicopper oxidase with cupredoxin domain [Clostridium saccharoperbutylacetonicum]|uniref:Multicopper oxidase Mco n=2 Tax=Clostridium saccharoperbutylacetonicum TaxID=36745 RepID=M1N220_9CLOT|nr:multicopper oxidase domain-containing protein [Clostridium saccharoperbutylacetonicum]AGF57532.1 multicopper oxidase Mco [Clostridium saccharoperbutylacetonicum N1-4(HMT)]NRT61700.1 FtsP/CotA-like multicopper oxidase with cupredoxin domain [Clostridium saccharoperbutylacetonicum]NSB44394.1 FtsP/CotA-like multicopper oxidase with cupredoxin domain [Clostridium saccharoperbutylacetonicum]